MADQQPLYPLDALDLPDAGGEPWRLSIVHRRGLAFCQVMARRGQSEALAGRLGIGAQPARATTTDSFTALPLAPGVWLMVAGQGRDGAFVQTMADEVEGLGYASEQSHGRVLIRLAGPGAREVLRKECRLDLRPDVLSPGYCGQTIMADVGVTLHYVDDQPTFDLILYPGYARSFWDWLQEAAAEFNPAVAQSRER